MAFKPTQYKLLNVADGHVFEDTGWTLADSESETPSLVRAVYENRNFEPIEGKKGLYRFGIWVPIAWALRHGQARGSV